MKRRQRGVGGRVRGGDGDGPGHRGQRGDGLVSRRPARRCPERPTAPCSRPTTSGTPPSRTCRSTRTARQWLASMDASTTDLHPDFGPSGDPSNPYGIPYTVVSPSQPLVPITFQYADQSDPGPYPFGADTPIEGGRAVHGRPPRHHGQPDHVHPLRALRRPVQPVGLDRGLGGDLEPGLQRPAPGRMDVGRCGRSPDPARARALRRGAVGRHHPCHPDDGRVDRHLVHLAGPPRGGDVVQPGPPAHGCPVPAQGQLRHLGLLAPGPGGAARHAAVRVDPGRQRLQLVLRGHGGRRTGRSRWSTSSRRCRPARSRRSTSRR